MTSNSDKLRSLILAALMVFSVFAGTVALSGSAAAVANDDASFDTLQPTNVEESADEVTHEFQVTFGGDGSINDAGDKTVTLTAPAPVVSLDNAEVTVGGNPVTPASTPSISGQEVTVVIADGDVSGGEEIVVTGEVTLDFSGDAYDRASAPVTAELEDGDGSTATATSDNVDVGASPLSSGSTFYTGQPVYVEGLDANSEYRVFSVDGDENPGTLQQLETTNDAGALSFDLDEGLSEGDFVLVDSDGVAVGVDDGQFDSLSDTTTGDNQAAAEQFSVVSQGLSAEFDDSTVGNDFGESTVDYEIDSTVRSTYLVNVSAQGDLDVDELSDIFETGDWTVVTEYDDDDTITVRADGSNTAELDGELDFQDIDAGTYTIDANVTDSSASDSDDIEVTDTGDEGASFSENVYTDQRGDIVNVSVEMENTDTATVQFGGSDDGYAIAAVVEDDDEDGVAYVEFNTFLAGDTSAEDETIVAGDDDTNIIDGPFTDGYTGNSDEREGDNTLEAGDYSIFASAAEETGIIGSSDSDARATLSLTDPSVEGAQVWTAPQDIESDITGADAEDIPAFAQAGNLTQANSIANGDVVVAQIEASGLEGAFTSSDAIDDYVDLTDDAENLGAYDVDDGGTDLVSLRFETSTGLNEDASTDVFIGDISDDATVLYDGDADVHYVVVGANDLVDQYEANGGTYDDGDEFVANFTTYDDNSDQFGSDSATDEFDIENPEIELDTNTDDEVVLEAAAGQEVTGDTNLAPASEIEVTLDSDTSGDPFVKRPETTVQADGTITVVADFSDNDAGSEFTAEPDAAEFTTVNVDTEEYDGRLVEATVTPGTETPDDSTGTETADEGTPEDTETADDSTPMDTEEPATTPGGEATETATGGSGPGFTAALALIALVAAALLAVRRNN